MVEFTLYSVTANLYVFVTLAAEFSLSGDVYTSSGYQVFNLLTISSQGSALIAFECLLTTIAVYLLAALILACRRLRWRYLASVWNCVDVLVVCLTWSSIVLFVTLMVHDDANVQSVFSANNPSYVSHAQSAAVHDVWRCVNALLLLLLIIIVARQLRFIRCMAAFVRTLRATMSTYGALGCMLIFLVLAYSLLGNLWYGGAVTEFQTVGRSFVSLSMMVRGRTEFIEVMLLVSRHFTVVFTTSLSVIVAMFIYASMLATLNNTHSSVRRKIFYYSPTNTRDYEMIGFLTEQLKKWLGITKPKPAFRQVNFQEDAAVDHCTHPSLVSLNNESQIDDVSDDDDTSDDDDEDADVDDDISLSFTSSADHSEVCDDTWIDGTTTPAWHRMLLVLNKIEEHDDGLDFQLALMARVLHKDKSGDRAAWTACCRGSSDSSA